MKYIIDRIENNIAVCETEDGEMVNIPLNKLPEGAAEGDILRSAGDMFQDGGDTLIVDAEARSAFQNEINKSMRKLWES